MKIKKLLPIVSSIFLLFILSGCAVKRGEVIINQQSNESQLSVYIKEVIDNRKFEVNPKKPNIPSLNPNELIND